MSIGAERIEVTMDKPLERDIEDVLIDALGKQPWVKQIWRQVKFPVGIADVIALIDVYGFNGFCVYEIKRGKVGKRAFTQLMGYLGQLERFIDNGLSDIVTDEFPEDLMSTSYLLYGTLVGAGASNMTARATSFIPNISFWRYHLENEQIIFETIPTEHWFSYKPDKLPAEIEGAIKKVSVSYRNMIYERWHTIHREGQLEAMERADDRLALYRDLEY